MITAKEIQSAAHATLDLLVSESTCGATAVYRRLSKLSGISVSMLRQFHNGERRNLGVENLDKLVAALETDKRLRAA